MIKYNTTSTIQPEEVETLISAGNGGVLEVLKDLDQSGLFMEDEMKAAMAADYKSIETGKNLLVITWWNKGTPESERSRIAFSGLGYDPKAESVPKIPEVWATDIKQFMLWVEGYQAPRDRCQARCFGKIEGKNFDDAVKRYVESLPSGGEKHDWSYRRGRWSFWGRRAYDNEADARRYFG